MAKPIRLLHVIGPMQPGGAEMLVMNILRHQSSAVENIILVQYTVSKDGAFDEEIKALGVRMYYIKSPSVTGIKKYVQNFQDVLEKIGEVDIVHSHLNAIGGVVAMAAKRCTVAKIIVHSHADITFKGSFINRVKKEIELFLMKLLILFYATDYWSCSELASKRLFFKSKNAVVINNSIDVIKYLRGDYGEKQNADELVLGSIGRLAKIKNYEFAIDVIKCLNDNEVKARFDCYGRTDNKEYLAQLMQKASDLGLKNKINFYGNTNDVPAALKTFDVFLMPSFSEGFGISAIEAQAAALPAVVSSGVPRDVDMGLGLVEFASDFDSQLWAALVQKSSGKTRPGNKEIIEAFESRGFDSKSNVKHIENLYEKIIQRGLA